jgi:hypothetical protein
MSTSFFCWVNQAGVGTQGDNETPNPVVYFALTDVNGSFNASWWYAVEPGKNQMLAVALAAIANQYQVHAFLDPAKPGPGPHPACYNLYLMAP